MYFRVDYTFQRWPWQYLPKGLPWQSSGPVQETGVQSLVGELRARVPWGNQRKLAHHN